MAQNCHLLLQLRLMFSLDYVILFLVGTYKMQLLHTRSLLIQERLNENSEFDGTVIKMEIETDAEVNAFSMSFYPIP